MHSYAAMATDYSKELEEWASSDYYDDLVYKIQLPYAQVGVLSCVKSTNGVSSRFLVFFLVQVRLFSLH